MEVTPAVVIVIAMILVVTFFLLRWGRRHEAPPPVEVPGTLARTNTMAMKEEISPLVNWLLDRALEQTGVRVADDAIARERIVQAALKAMEDLQTSESAEISLPFLAADGRGPKHFTVQIKRKPDSKFELQG